MIKYFFILMATLNLAQSVWGDCQFESAPIVLETRKSHIIQYWDFSNASVLNSNETPSSKTYNDYKKLVSEKLDTDTINLLKRYKEVATNEHDLYNLDTVLNDSQKFIRPIHCLEALLLTNQIERNIEMTINPTEFLAFYLKNAEGKLRVYYLTDDMSGVRKVDGILNYIQNDIDQGWILLDNLHNHSFFLNNLHIDEDHHPQGVLIPSANDIQVLRATRDEFKMQQALVTNGYNTIVMSAADLDLFHDPAGK